MRKVTKLTIAAFMSNTPVTLGNTCVTVGNGTTNLFIHNNLIATKTGSKIQITNAGWKSNVAKERLNGIPGVEIRQCAGGWVLNGKLWDGKLIEVK